MDCVTLRLGMENFANHFKDFTYETCGERIDIRRFLTICSFSNYYFSTRGCYFGVWEVSGSTRNFIQESLYGGRVVGNREYMKEVIEGRDADDFDVSSLYPRAIQRIGEEMGFPVGSCECLLPGEDYWQYWWFIVKIKILFIDKYQQIPMINRCGSKMEWHNRGDTPEGYFVVGRLALEDWIVFCRIRYEVVDGVAWKSTHEGNKKCARVMGEMYELTQRYKK